MSLNLPPTDPNSTITKYDPVLVLPYYEGGEVKIKTIHNYKGQICYATTVDEKVYEIIDLEGQTVVIPPIGFQEWAILLLLLGVFKGVEPKQGTTLQDCGYVTRKVTRNPEK